MPQVKTDNDRIAVLEQQLSKIASAMAVLLEQQQPKAQQPKAPAAVVVTENGATKLHGNPTDQELRDYAKSKGLEVRGAISPKRREQWLALWNADHKTANAKVEQRVANGASRFGTYTVPERSANRRFGIPTAAEATSAMRTDPDRAAMESLKVDDWLALSQHGAGHKVRDGKVIRVGRPNPTNLDANDRRVCHYMADYLTTGKCHRRNGSAFDLSDNIRYAACGIVRKARAAGFAV